MDKILALIMSNAIAVTVSESGENKMFCVSDHFYVNGSEPGIGETAILD